VLAAAGLVIKVWFGSSSPCGATRNNSHTKLCLFRICYVAPPNVAETMVRGRCGQGTLGYPILLQNSRWVSCWKNEQM